MRRNEIISLCVATALLVLLFVVLQLRGVLELSNRIDTSQLIQIIITFVLVLVTVAYVKRTAEIAGATKQQADASLRMAEEMKKQRLDLARPVIDIQREDTGAAHISAGLAAESGDFTWGLSCKLHNIGLGPAVDIYSYIQFQQRSLRIDFGTIAAKERTKKEEKLSVFQEDGRLVLKVYYKDIYGRDFESSRVVQIGKVTSSAESGLGPLKSILV